MSEELSGKAQEILAAVVQEYLLTNEPVGSRTLVRHYSLDKSPSTVRSVMSELEERGLLCHPHTSAGRVPTDRGLRLYVERLMTVRELTTEERQEIKTRYNLHDLEVQELLREVSRLTSDISQECALVLAPRRDVSLLRRIQFVPLRPGAVIAVLVMDSGLVQNRLLNLTDQLLPHELEGIHRYLNELCQGLPLSEVRRLVSEELKRERNRYDELVTRALELGARALAGPCSDEVLVEGQSRLLHNPRGLDTEEVKAVLRALEEKELILRLLDETARARGVQIFIGAETMDEEMKRCALVAVAYGGDRPLGTLGVIGPFSMDYPRVVPVVGLAAEILTERLLG